jgi:hypothetical protein
MTPKHIETPKKPKEATLPDSNTESVDEGDGPSFTSYIGKGQNVDHDDESFWPYFISAQKRKKCSGTCICPRSRCPGQPKTTGKSIRRHNFISAKQIKPGITANILELD